MSVHNSGLEKALIERSVNLRRSSFPRVYSALELADMEFPESEWIIKDILPPGVTHFAGKEKMFKSFAALGMCVAASNGDSYLGFEPVGGYECLYFDLESNEERPSKRLNLMREALHLSHNCHVITSREMESVIDGKKEPCTLGTDFTDMLLDCLDVYPKTKIIVIDVFKRVRSTCRRGESTYDWDYRDVGALKTIADERRVAIIIINHVVKGDVYEDDLDNARGSGINAAADCIWILKKNPNAEYSGTLKIRGRDVEPQEYSITFNNRDFVWERNLSREDEELNLLKSEYAKTNIRQTLETITQWSVVWEGSPADLIATSFKTNTAIALDSKQLGMSLNKYETLLREDGFTFTKNRQSKGTIYRFVNNNHEKGLHT